MGNNKYTRARSQEINLQEVWNDALNSNGMKYRMLELQQSCNIQMCILNEAADFTFDADYAICGTEKHGEIRLLGQLC